MIWLESAATSVSARTSRLADVQALTRCSGSLFCLRPRERRSVLPSIRLPLAGYEEIHEEDKRRSTKDTKGHEGGRGWQVQAGVAIWGEPGGDGMAGQAVTNWRVERSRVGERLDRQCEMRSCS